MPPMSGGLFLRLKMTTAELDIPSGGGLDLDSLLSESLEITQKERQMKASKKAGNKGMPQQQDQAGWMTGKELDEHYKQVAKIKENAEGWKTVCAILLIHSQICSTCHSEHQSVEGIFVKREHLKLRAVNYLVPKALLDWNTLPREVEVRPAYVHMCPSCYGSQGWNDIPINIKE
jgi:hypothetical protein